MGPGWRELSREQLRRMFIVPPFPPTDCRLIALDRGMPVPQEWDIVGIWQRRSHPLLLDVFLIHVDQARIVRLTSLYKDRWLPDITTSDPPLNLAEEEAGTIGFTPAEYLLLIHLLEQFLQPMPVEPEQFLTHFELVAPPEQLWPPTPETLFSFEPCYRYVPDPDIPAAESQVAVVSTPEWETQGSSPPISYLSFKAFDRSRYDDPDFDPYIEHGLGYITLNAGALRDLVALLKRHAYNAP